jgi:hypothetical protein
VSDRTRNSVATGWTCNDAYEEEGRIRRVGVDEGDLEAAVVNRKPTDDGEHDGLESQSLIEDEQHHRPLYPIDEGLPTGPRTGDYAFTVAGIRMQRTDKANLGEPIFASSTCLAGVPSSTAHHHNVLQIQLYSSAHLHVLRPPNILITTGQGEWEGQLTMPVS